MRGAEMTNVDLYRNAFLARETIEEWTRRWFRERGLPEPTDAELKEIIALGREDERTGHQ